MFVQQCLFSPCRGVSLEVIELQLQSRGNNCFLIWRLFSGWILIWAAPVTSPVAAVECGVCVCVFTCIWAHTCTGSMNKWVGAVGEEESKRFQSSVSFFSSPLRRSLTLCSSPPRDKIRTTCSSHLLARESQADLLTHALPLPTLHFPALSLMSGKWKVVPWQLALDSQPEGVRLKRSGLFPFTLMCIFHLCVARELHLAH